MTKLTTTSNEKPASEPVVDEERKEDDVDDDDEDLKKNIYNEIPEYDDLDDVKIDADEMTKSKEAEVVLLQLQQLNHLQQLRQQNAVNENLYSEIHLNEERFENAVYMQHQQQENPEKVVDGGIFPSKSSKTRSFFPVGVPLPGIPQQGEHRPKMIIPEEPEPSWCCGTRRRRRRSLILGLFLTSFFLLFLCIALLVRMYVPTPVVDYDEGFEAGISSAEFLQGGTSDWAAENQMGADAEFTPTEKTIKRTFHTQSICTSWQGRRRLTLSCDDPDAKIHVQRSFYGWSHTETVCHQVSGDTTCRVGESDVAPRCNGYNNCRFSADASGWVVGCHGFHDFLQVDFYCVS
jgi:hypothetical protein